MTPKSSGALGEVTSGVDNENFSTSRKQQHGNKKDINSRATLVSLCSTETVEEFVPIRQLRVTLFPNTIYQ